MESRKRGFLAKMGFSDFGVERKKIRLARSTKSYPSHPECLFDLLPVEVVHHILSYLPLPDVGVFAMASKKTNRIARQWMNDCCVKHWSVDYCSEENDANGSCIFECNGADELYNKCHSFGLMAKRVSMLYPVGERLELFRSAVEKFQDEIVNSCSCIDEEEILKCKGIMLHIYTAGWEDAECIKVYSFLTNSWGIQKELENFLQTPQAELNEVDWVASDGRQMFLRQTLRGLFLDACVVDSERAAWMGVMCQQMNASQLAKFLILLYGPVRQGVINWRFPQNIRSFELYAEEYKTLAKILSILRLIPNWTPASSIHVLVYMSNCPACWLLRSFSSLLLPLSVVDKDLVVDYFNILYTSGRSATASLLLALTVMVSPTLIRSAGEIEMGDTTVKDMVMAVMENPRVACKRSAARQMWESVQLLAEDFASSAILGARDEDGEASELLADLSGLLNGWRVLAAELMDSLY